MKKERIDGEPTNEELEKVLEKFKERRSGATTTGSNKKF
jgi:hypothetical protein